MGSFKVVGPLIATLIASTCAFPTFPALESNELSLFTQDLPIDRNSLLNPNDFETGEVLDVAKHGKRVANDQLLESGHCIRVLKNDQTTERINLSTDNSQYVISYVEFKYTNMNDKEKKKKSSLDIMRGGAGHQFVDFFFSSEDDSMFISYSVYGINNTCKTIPTRTIHKVESEKDLENKFFEARSGKLVVLYFSAHWFEADKEFERRIEKLALKNLDVVFLKIDVDSLEEVAKKFNVRDLPVFVFVKLDKEVDSRVEGVEKAEEKIQEIIDKHRKGE